MNARPSLDAAPESSDAFAAFLRALEAAIRVEGALSPFDFDRRLALVRRLRKQLA